MEHILQIKIRNSECNMPKNRRILLTYERPGLVPCKLEETADECIFLFDTEGFTDGEMAKQLDIIDKYRFLSNCADLAELTKEYQFSLSPANIVYDRNLCAAILLRDKKTDNSGPDFFVQYQALVAVILHPKYTFEQYLQNGNALYSKNKHLKRLQQQQTVKELKQYLLESWEEELYFLKKEKKLVSRSGVLAVKLMIPVLIGICLFSSYSWIRLRAIQLPYQEKLLAAHASYLSSEYVKVEDILSSIPLSKLPLESRYILARSYIYTEGLTPAQRDNLLAGISLTIDEIIYEFWIELGRGNYEQAVDTAMRLGDDELLLYAYIKQSAYAKTDTTLSGEEKAKLISTLEGDISKMSESIAAEKANLVEATRAALEVPGTDTQESEDAEIEDEIQGETDENTDIVQ